MAFTLEIDDKKSLAWLDDLPATVKTALLENANQLAKIVQSKVQAEIGGGVLDAVSGDLRDSISAKVEIHGNSVEATVSSSSPYAGALEFGVNKMEAIPAHKREITMLFGDEAKRAILAEVRPSNRLQAIKGRHFMGLVAGDMREQIIAEMKQAVTAAVAIK